MPKERNPKRDEAFKMWKKKKGNIPLIEIATKLGLAPAPLEVGNLRTNGSSIKKRM